MMLTNIPIPSLDQFQFVILSVVVTLAAYVGTVARVIAGKIGNNLKNGEKRETRKIAWYETLWFMLVSLIIADICLISIAVWTMLRIYWWINQIPIPLEQDQYLVFFIMIVLGYMSLLHLGQWFIWGDRVHKELQRTGRGSKV